MTKLNQIPIPELFVSPAAAEKLGEEAAKLPVWTLDSRQLGDLELLMNGGFFPLKGFMTQADCDSVEVSMTLTSGAFWPLPVTLGVDAEFASGIEPGDDIGLQDDQGRLLAIMSVTDCWQHEATEPTDAISLGGKVKGLRSPARAATTPNHMRGLFLASDRNRVVAFHEIEILPAPEEGTMVMLMPFPGQLPLPERDGTSERSEPALTGRPDACFAPINLMIREKGLRMAALLACVARNYGATHVLADDEPALMQALNDIGLELIPRRLLLCRVPERVFFFV